MPAGDPQLNLRVPVELRDRIDALQRRYGLTQQAAAGLALGIGVAALEQVEHSAARLVELLMYSRGGAG